MSAIVERKIVRVSYIMDDIFRIPRNINLEDKSQVECWGVKWNVLHIQLVGGEVWEIQSHWNTPDNMDFKRPANIDIETDEEFDEEEEETIVHPELELQLEEAYREGKKEGIEEGTKEEEIEEIKKPEIASWREVVKKIEDYLKSSSNDISAELIWKRQLVWGMMTEISENSYLKMEKIAEMLFSINADYYSEEWDIPEDMRKKIFNIGLELHKQGGKQLQQLCFYMAVNFMSNDKRLKSIELCWDGAGEWKY